MWCVRLLYLFRYTKAPHHEQHTFSLLSFHETFLRFGLVRFILLFYFLFFFFLLLLLLFSSTVIMRNNNICFLSLSWFARLCFLSERTIINQREVCSHFQKIVTSLHSMSFPNSMTFCSNVKQNLINRKFRIHFYCFSFLLFIFHHMSEFKIFFNDVELTEKNSLDLLCLVLCSRKMWEIVWKSSPDSVRIKNMILSSCNHKLFYKFSFQFKVQKCTFWPTHGTTLWRQIWNIIK